MAVEQLTRVLFGTQPMMAAKERAHLPCGCSILVGIRLDTQELATGSLACGPDHAHVTAHANLLLRESLVDPTPRPLAEVADDMLAQAARAYGVPA